MKLALFEGPLDLLLHLIERNELDISAVSLVLVVDQYMQYLGLMHAEMKLEAAAEFLVVAGKLLLIKSRSLLPRPDPPVEEGEEDPAEELARQLEEFRAYKLIAEQLRAIKEERGPTFGRSVPTTDVPASVKLLGLDLDKLVDAFRRTLERALEQAASTGEAPERRVTQADRINVIETGLAGGRTLLFDTLLEDCRSVEDVIVTFLAVLELLKQQRLRVWQRSAFGSIILSRARHA